MEANHFLQLCSKEDIVADSYLIPHATLELGLNYMRLGDFIKARQWLDECKTYSSYALETIVHFRMHTAIRTMSLITKQQKRQQQQIESMTNVNDYDAEKESDNKSGSTLGSIWNVFSRRVVGDKSATVVDVREANEETVESL